MREPNLMMSLLIMLIFPLEAHRQWCGNDNECSLCEGDYTGTVVHGPYQYECKDGLHAGPTACLTKVGDAAAERHKVVANNRRGIHKIEQVGNCHDPKDFIEITCDLKRNGGSTFKCVNPQQRDCVSPGGIKVPLGVGIEEEGNIFFCALRYYAIFYGHVRPVWSRDVAFLFDCRYDELDYQESFTATNGHYGGIVNQWDYYCNKDKAKFVLPRSTAYDYLDRAECKYDLAHNQFTKTPFTIKNGEWAIIGKAYNVSCSRTAEAKVENCVSYMGVPIPFGQSHIEDFDAKRKANWTCLEFPKPLLVRKIDGEE